MSLDIYCVPLKCQTLSPTLSPKDPTEVQMETVSYLRSQICKYLKTLLSPVAHGSLHLTYLLNSVSAQTDSPGLHHYFLYFLKLFLPPTTKH